MGIKFYDRFVKFIQAPVIALVAQPVEHRQAIIVASDGLAIYQARDSPERERSARDQWDAPGPVMPVASEKPHARRIAAHHHPEAVCLVSCSQTVAAVGFATGLDRQGWQKSGKITRRTSTRYKYRRARASRVGLAHEDENALRLSHRHLG